MLAEVLDEAWRVRKTASPIETSLRFCDDGLVLGAGTVLAPSVGARGGFVFEEDNARLRTLISVAYGRLVDPDVLAHIRRGARCWSDGDEALASVHLAHSRLGKLRRPQDAARRLFLADHLMQAGAEPEIILRAAGLRAPKPDEELLRFQPDQPRIPAGSPQGGQWLAELGAAIARLSPKVLLGMSRVALRVGGPATFLTVLFTPTPTGGRGHIIDVPGQPGLTLSRGGDETMWRLTDDYTRTTTFLQDSNGALTDEKGRIVGRILENGHLALDLAAVAPERVRDEPQLCPAPTRDKFGQGPDSTGRAYEDQVKAVVNPGAPTPTGLAVVLPNPLMKTGRVYFDDCQRNTGAMIEAKGPTFGDLWQDAKKSNFEDSVVGGLLTQSLNQVQAAPNRPIIWFFADVGTAAAAHKLFDESNEGRGRIKIVVLPYVGRRK